MKKTIWDIKKGDVYYILHPNGWIDRLTWENNYSDKRYRDCFNAFLTKEEAEAELEARKKKALQSKPILDEAERRYLKAVIRPFRDDVKYIEKRGFIEEYIHISLNKDNAYLPSFDKNTMYKGMEAYRSYTLEELGL